MSNCFHCGDLIPTNLIIESVIDSEQRAFCCHGCQAIAEYIEDANLCRYYERREVENLNISQSRIDTDKIYALLDNQDIYNRYVFQEGDRHHIQLSIEGITCSACAWLIEKHLSTLSGILHVGVNVSSAVASIEWQPELISIKDIAKALKHIGYASKPYLPGERANSLKQEKNSAIIQLGIAGVGMMQVMMSAVAMYAGDIQGMEDIYRNLLRWTSFFFATPVVFYSASSFFKGAWRDLRTRHFTMDLPVSIGIGLAYLSSVYALLTNGGHVYFDSVTMFTFFLLLGRFLETLARNKEFNDGEDNALQATERKSKDGWEITSVSSLAVGDIIRIKPGETFPVDGYLLNSATQVDESSLTGEYLPVIRNPGDAISAQTVNVDQQVELAVTAAGANTRAAAITRITERAIAEKPKVAIIADAVAHYFVIGVLITAALTYLGWSYVGNENAYWIMVSVLVVTCPCALSLATPVALTSATNYLRQVGLLVTRGHTLESLAATDHVVFDKTGTLTQGSFSITQIDVIDTSLSEDQVLTIAASLEQHSTHPIAKVFKQFTTQQVNDLRNIMGKGVSGTIDEQHYFLGNKLLAEESIGHTLSANGAQGLVLYLCTHQECIARFHLTDQVRKETAKTLESLRNLGIRVSLLTGDSIGSTKSTFPLEWFDDVEASVSPEGKWEWLKQNGKSHVVMVGDGLNDVPALAGSTTSIAMGSSSDLAKTHSDAILLNSNIALIHKAILKAKKCSRIIKQNLSWALAYNLIMLPAAVAGFVPPWAAAIGMALSSLLVVVNATRLSRDN